jgi:hypothetical protein
MKATTANQSVQPANTQTLMTENAKPAAYQNSNTISDVSAYAQMVTMLTQLETVFCLHYVARLCLMLKIEPQNV